MGRQGPKVLVEDAMGDTVGDKWETQPGFHWKGTVGKTVGDNWETAGTEVGDRGGQSGTRFQGSRWETSWETSRETSRMQEAEVGNKGRPGSQSSTWVTQWRTRF